MSITQVTKTNMMVLLVLASRDGSANCGAFLASSPQITSVQMILLQNFGSSPSSSMSYTDSLGHNTTSIAVSLSRLYPSTIYKVYCMTSSATGGVMTLSRALSSLQLVTTACCKSISVTLTSQAVYVLTPNQNAIRINIDVAPTSNLQLQFVLKNSTGGNLHNNAFFPTSLLISPSTNAFASFFISLQPITSEGSYLIFVSCSGSSATEFNISYPYGNTLSVINSGQSIPPPQLMSVDFSQMVAILRHISILKQIEAVRRLQHLSPLHARGSSYFETHK